MVIYIRTSTELALTRSLSVDCNTHPPSLSRLWKHIRAHSCFGHLWFRGRWLQISVSEPTEMGKQPVKLDWLSTDPVQPEGICIDSSYGLTCVIGVCPVEHGLVTMSPQHTWQLRPQPGSAFYSAADICTPSIQQLGWTSITERRAHSCFNLCGLITWCFFIAKTSNVVSIRAQMPGTRSGPIAYKHSPRGEAAE